MALLKSSNTAVAHGKICTLVALLFQISCGKDLKMGEAPNDLDCAKLRAEGNDENSPMEQCAAAAGRAAKDSLKAKMAELELRLKPNTNSITIEWDKFSGAESYHLYWNNKGSVTTHNDQLSANDTTFVHKPLEQGKTYYYILTVILPGGIESPPTKEYFAQVQTPVYFVNQKYGNDNNDGSSTRPKKTLNAALQFSDAAFSVYVSEGSYNETVVLKDGVTLQGGFSAEDWLKKDASLYPSILVDSRTSGGNAVNNPLRTVDISNAQAGVLVEGFTVQAAAVESDKYAAAIFIKDSKNVKLVKNKVLGPKSSLIGCGISVLKSAAEIMQNAIYGGEGSYAVGIYVLDQSSLRIEGNQVNAGKASANAIGLNDFGTGNLTVNGNHFYGGTGQVSYGARLASVKGTKMFVNNTVDGGDSGMIIGVEVSGTQVSSDVTVFLRNNTISGGGSRMASGITESYGVMFGNNVNQSVELANNIIYMTNLAPARHCIYERFTDSTPKSVRNNNLFGCLTSLYHNAQGAECASTNCQSIWAMESLSDMLVTGNISMPLQFNADMSWTQNAHPNVSQGGLDGSALGWTILTDKKNVARTNVRTGNPDNAGAGGWSMGAYEVD